MLANLGLLAAEQRTVAAVRRTAFTQLYPMEEIQPETLVRYLTGFARFLYVTALLHGQTLNASYIAREALAARTTGTRNQEVLEEDAFVLQVAGF